MYDLFLSVSDTQEEFAWLEFVGRYRHWVRANDPLASTARVAHESHIM